MWKSLLNRLKTMNLPFKSKIYVAKDLQGNRYFEDGRRRIIEYQDGRNHPSQYYPDTIPLEFQAWLRHTRADAPTLEELQRNQEYKNTVQQNIKELDK
jgi:NADH dehydrogenase [ubiquinone] 1 alpha subcomplex assembly factor 2